MAMFTHAAEIDVLNGIQDSYYPTGMAFTPVPSAFGGRFFPFLLPLFFVDAASSSFSGTDQVLFFSGT